MNTVTKANEECGECESVKKNKSIKSMNVFKALCLKLLSSILSVPSLFYRLLAAE